MHGPRRSNVFYGEKQALFDVDLDIPHNQVTALIGPVGLRQVDLPALREPHERRDPELPRRGQDHARRRRHLRARASTWSQLRARVGMVFQKPNPFPKSIYENVAYGPRIHGLAERASRARRDRDAAASSARACWTEVKDRLDESGTSLSGGQQQRLCIARAIAVSPEVILMDEPCSALDPIATARIEELIDELRESYTIVIVTHSMQQAARVSQRTAFFHLGRVDRGRRYRADLHRPPRDAGPGLHHGPLRLGEVMRVVDPVLQELRTKLLRMGSLAEAILEKALTAVWKRDRAAAREVQIDDLEIDRLDLAIDEAVLRILATQAPVADDLRSVIAAKMIATDLERSGRPGPEHREVRVATRGAPGGDDSPPAAHAG